MHAGARCRLHKAAANQITAVRNILEAVGVKSFGRATTELRADLDTPALAEALKTTERKLQMAEQRVATLEASLTRQQSLPMHGELFESHRHSCRRGRRQPLLQESLSAVLWCRARGNAEGAVFECELPGAEFATVCVRTGQAQPGTEAEHRYALAIRKPSWIGFSDSRGINNES